MSEESQAKTSKLRQSIVHRIYRGDFMSRYKVIDIRPVLTDEERKRIEADVLRKLVEIYKEDYSQEE